MIRLGLIGDNIRESSAPRLHRLAGELTGQDIRYDLLIPAVEGLDFNALFARSAQHYRGLNITYPYKERVTGHVDIPDPAVRALGACNTVLFGDGRQTGYNTDYSGFRRAFEVQFPDRRPGHVAMAGAGGVGKAIAFALADLKATSLTIYEPVSERADALVSSLRIYAPHMDVRPETSLAEAMSGAMGAVNATPLGMSGIGGTAFPKEHLIGLDWAFDAVYTPVRTKFLGDAAEAGAAILSGYELFFHQGVDAFNLFTNHSVDDDALRAALKANP